MSTIPLIILGVTALLFVLPFGKPKPGYTEFKKPNSLIKLLFEGLSKFPRNLAETLFIVPAVLTQLMPALMAWQVFDVAPHSGIGGLMIIESLILLLGTAITFLLMILTYVSFMWGSSSSGKVTWIGFTITGLNLLAVIAGFITAFAPNWLAKLS